MENFDQEFEVSPYVLIGVSQNANDEEIQARFHEKMRGSSNQEQLLKAYIQIRNQAGRNDFKWNTIGSFIADPFKEENCSNLDLEELIKEIAFLSDWEVGELKDV